MSSTKISITIFLIFASSLIGIHWGWLDDVWQQGIISGTITHDKLYDFSSNQLFISRLLHYGYLFNDKMSWNGIFQVTILMFAYMFLIKPIKLNTNKSIVLVMLYTLIYLENIIAITFTNVAVICYFTGVYILFSYRNNYLTYLASLLFFLIAVFYRFELFALIAIFGILFWILHLSKIRSLLITSFFLVVSCSVYLFYYFNFLNIDMNKKDFIEYHFKLNSVSDFGYGQDANKDFSTNDSLALFAVRTFMYADTAILNPDFLNKATVIDNSEELESFSFQDRMFSAIAKLEFEIENYDSPYNYMYPLVLYLFSFTIIILLVQIAVLRRRLLLAVFYIISFLVFMILLVRMEYRFFWPFFTVFSALLILELNRQHFKLKSSFIFNLILISLFIYQGIRINALRNKNNVVYVENQSFIDRLAKLKAKYIFLDYVTASSLPFRPLESHSFLQRLNGELLAYPDLMFLPFNNDFSKNYLNNPVPSYKLDQFGEFIIDHSDETVFVYYEGLRAEFYEEALKKYKYNFEFVEIDRIKNVRSLIAHGNPYDIVVYKVIQKQMVRLNIHD